MSKKKTNDGIGSHPEVRKLKELCQVAPEDQSTKQVCELLNQFIEEKTHPMLQTCDVCGNMYAHCLEVRQRDAHYIFDCVECLIQKIAPMCRHCSCRIIGHGIEVGDAIFYCSAHCAREAGYPQVRDHY